MTVGPSPCSGLPWSSGAWVELLRVELATDGVRVREAESSGASPAQARAALEPLACSDSAGAATLTFSSGGLRRTKTIVLTDVQPVARPRVLAIAMAELVRQGLAAAKAAEATTVAAPSTPQELDVRIRLDHPEVSQPEPTARAASDRSWAVFAAAETKLFAQGTTGLFGARGGAIVPLGGWLELGADLGLLAGTGHDPLGDIDETVVALGATLFAVGGTKNLAFGVGPRVEAGLGWFRGHASTPLAAASDARSAVALWALSGMATFRIAGAVSGLIALDVGTSVYGFSGRADQRSVSDVVGPFLATRIGFAWTP